jgi:DNA-binding NarL/FixJ family response regulator
LEGRVFVSDRVSDRLLARAALQPADQRGRSPVDTLSNRELVVFELIGNGIAKQQIADRLHVSVKTVDTHRHNIKIKLELPDAAAVAHFATQWVLSEK